MTPEGGAARRPTSALVVDALAAAGTTHLLGIPDSSSAALFDRVATDPRMGLLTVTREGEAFAVAAGLWVGGARPAVSVQCTGLLESGDSLRGTVLRMGVPLLCLVGYRGYARMAAAGMNPPPRPPSPAQFRRPDVDSAALLTEPTLDAWGLPHQRLTGPDPTEQIGRAWQQALDEERPVVLLLDAPLD